MSTNGKMTEIHQPTPGPSTNLQPQSQPQHQINPETPAAPILSTKARLKAEAKARAKAAKVEAQAQAQVLAQAKAAQAAQAARSKPLPVPVGPFDIPHEDEERTVHAVYEAIAPHFSQTRHKPWPLITTFLNSLPNHAIGLDSGAGNGKYVPVAKHGEARAEMIALDRSEGLLGLAKSENGAECVRGDLGFTGWRQGVFDFAISVAAIHHLSTPERRCHAVQTLVRPLRLTSTPPYSRFMIYVWAYEQGQGSKRRMGVLAPTVGGSGNDEAINKSSQVSATPTTNGDLASTAPATTSSLSSEQRIQDVLVPWVYIKPGESSKQKSAEAPKHSTGVQEEKTFQTLPQEQEQAQKQDQAQNQGRSDGETKADADAEPQVFHRYYHLFVEGELREMVLLAAKLEGFTVLPDLLSDSGDNEERSSNDDTEETRGESGDGQSKFLRVRGVGWEADNWWLEGEVGLI